MTFVLIVRMQIWEGQEDEAARVIRELTDESREEAGCLAYIPLRDSADPRTFVIYEHYRDKGALKEHEATAHFQRLAAGRLFGLMESSERVFYEPLV